MDSLLSQQLDKASFRGVPFAVRRAGDTVGRAVATHVFPLREDPYVEDMGPALRVIKVSAFVLGKDWREKRDQLQKALNEAGSGTLVHPWYGSLQVALRSASVTHEGGSLGMATFELEFVRVGQADSPGATANARHVTTLRAGAAGMLAAARVQGRLLLEDMGQYVLQEAHAALAQLLDQCALLGGELGVDLAEITAWTVMGTGDALWLYDAVRGGTFGGALLELFTGLAMAASESVQGPDPTPFYALSSSAPVLLPPINAGISRRTTYENALALSEARRELAAISALQLTSVWTPATRQDALLLRREAVSCVDAVQLSLADATDPTQGAELYSTMAALRSSALAAMAEASGRAPELVRVGGHVRHISLPSLALLHRVTGRIDGEADFLGRNGVTHPGFVPAGQDLEVLYAR